LTLSAADASSIVAYVEAEAAHTGHAAAAAPAGATLPVAAKPAAPASPDRIAPVTLVDAAIAIQVALAHDAIDGLQAQARTLAREAAALGPSAAEIDRAANDLGRQTTVEDARTAFANVSDALIGYLHDAKLPAPAGVRTAYCPMLRKSWLQRDGAIA